MIIENIVDLVERHPICTALILMYLLSPIPFSVVQWGEHPKRLICYDGSICKLETYSYKNTICWDSLFASRHSRRRMCKLPKYKTSEKDLLTFGDIQDVVVKKVGNENSIYFKSKNGEDVYLDKYRTFDDANYKAFLIKRYIKKLQNPSSNILEYGESNAKFELNL